MPRPASRRTSTAAVLLALALASGACSGGDDDEPASPAPDSSTRPAPEVKLEAGVATVAGELPRRKRRAVARDVGAAVDRWFEAAYLGGGYPRTAVGDAWPGFTAGAVRLARRQRNLTSNALLSDRIDGVTAVRKLVRVDVLSPRRRPAGATARFRLVYDTSGDATRRVVVGGRLLLTRERGRWKVFGFDVNRSARPRPGEESS